MSSINAASTFAKPKCITVNSKCTYRVLKVFLGIFGLPNPQLMVSCVQLYFGVDPCLFQLVKMIIDPWQQVLILNGDSIQLSVVNTESKSPIPVPDK